MLARGATYFARLETRSRRSLPIDDSNFFVTGAKATAHCLRCSGVSTVIWSLPVAFAYSCIFLSASSCSRALSSHCHLVTSARVSSSTLRTSLGRPSQKAALASTT